MFKTLFISLILFSINVRAELVGTVWSQKSELTVDGKLLCSYDLNKPSTFHYDGGYLRIDRLNNGWFKIEAGRGCAVGWFGSHSFMFQQVGTDVLDRDGNKIGHISPTEIELSGGSDWSAHVIIRKLIVKENNDGSAGIFAEFAHKNPYGHKVFQFKSDLTVWNAN